MPAVRGQDSKKKTRRYKRDMDQIAADIKSPRHLEQFHETKTMEEMPGLGQWYCKECAKFYESEFNFNAHKKHKVHKRRLRALRDEPYSHKEAEAGMMGLTTDNGKRATTTLMEVDAGADAVAAA